MIYFPTNWGAKEPQNLPNHRVVEEVCYVVSLLSTSTMEGLLYVKMYFLSKGYPWILASVRFECTRGISMAIC